MTSNEELEQARFLAIAELDNGMRKVGKSIDDLTSSGLKKVLKAVSHVHLAEQLTGGDALELTEDEQVLIDRIFALQESVMGFAQLEKELNDNNVFASTEDNNEGESNE